MDVFLIVNWDAGHESQDAAILFGDFDRQLTGDVVGKEGF
ncbi:hypothetical protein GCM10028804_33400 [Larkinella terrae]